MSFQFSVIRFVPDPARGEFVNIGAIAGSDEAREWELRLVSNRSRARALDDRGVLSKAFAYAARLEEHIAARDHQPKTGGPEPISSSMLRRRAAEMHNVVQFSPPAPVAADSAESALELVFDQLVVDAAAGGCSRIVANRRRKASERRKPENPATCGAFVRAAEGTRTLDLLHGKQTL